MKQTTTADESPQSNTAAWNDMVNSFLHRIVARPKVLPYTDIVRWVVDQLDITDRMFITLKKIVIGSLKVEDLRKMYRLPQLQKGV